MGQLTPWIDVSFETCPLNNCFATISHELFDYSMLLFSLCPRISMHFLSPTRDARSNLFRSEQIFLIAKIRKNMEKCARIFLRWKGTQSHAFHTLFSNYPLSFRDTT